MLSPEKDVIKYELKIEEGKEDSPPQSNSLQLISNEKLTTQEPCKQVHSFCHFLLVYQLTIFQVTFLSIFHYILVVILMIRFIKYGSISDFT